MHRRSRKNLLTLAPNPYPLLSLCPTVKMLRLDLTPATLNQRQEGSLPALLGIEVVALAEGNVRMAMEVTAHHMASNGYLHAASVVALADTAAGYGCVAHLPDGALGFTTVELKSNFIGTARSGRITAEATLIHGGRSTQLWDAVVRDAEGKTIALFRCTQMLLWPRVSG